MATYHTVYFCKIFTVAFSYHCYLKYDAHATNIASPQWYSMINNGNNLLAGSNLSCFRQNHEKGKVYLIILLKVSL